MCSEVCQNKFKKKIAFVCVVILVLWFSLLCMYACLCTRIYMVYLFMYMYMYMYIYVCRYKYVDIYISTLFVGSSI